VPHTASTLRLELKTCLGDVLRHDCVIDLTIPLIALLIAGSKCCITLLLQLVDTSQLEQIEHLYAVDAKTRSLTLFMLTRITWAFDACRKHIFQVQLFVRPSHG
jgi:ABC-type microcin C transport system permease subunit YejB